MSSVVLPGLESPLRKSVASDISYTSTTTLVTTTGLTAVVGGTPAVKEELAKSATYRVRGLLVVDGDSAGDVKFQFSLPAGTTFIGRVDATYQDGTAANTFQTTASGTKQPVVVEGTLKTGTTQGTVALQAAQAASSATATKVFAGSYLEFSRV